MKIAFLTFLICLMNNLNFAQSKVIDSLKHQLTIAKNDTNKVLIMSKLCNNYRTSTKPDSAFYFGEQALKISRKIKFLRGEANALSFLSRANREIGNLPKALDFALKALRIVEENKYLNEKIECFTSLGVIYFDLKDYSKFINYNKMASAIKQQIPSTSQDYYFEVQIASGYIKNNQWDSAYYYVRQTNQGKIPSTYIGNYQTFYRVLGWINIKLGNHSQGVSHFKNGIQTAILNNDYRNASFNTNELASFYLKSGKVDSCIFFAKQGLDEAQKGPFNIRILESSDFLSKAYKIKGDYKKAYEYQELMIKTKESLYGAGNIQAMQTMIADDEARRKEVESEKLAYKNQIRQYGLLIGLGIMMLIGVILYRNNRQKQKANLILQEQKDKVESTLIKLHSTQAQLIQSEKLASLGELTAGIAHEIQNPLNFVNNFSEVSSELVMEMKEELAIGNQQSANEIADDLKSNLEKITLHGKRASSIVKGMLEHSKASSGEKELTDINALADEYLRLSYHGLRAKDKNFNADFQLIKDESIPKIAVISQDMGRVLLNLINNAFYAVGLRSLQGLSYLKGLNEYQPTVTVSTQKFDNQIIIKIKDNGIGMSEATKAKIFQPFFTTKPTGQGTGLGLSLAYDIVTKGHGGSIEVESVEGEGTEFVVKLPI